MNILFVTIQSNPFDPTYGGAQRSRLLLDACVSMGHVDVVIFNCKEDIISTIPNCDLVYSGYVPMVSKPLGRKDKICSLLHYSDIYSYYCNNPQMEKIVDQIIANGNYDYIVVRYLSETIQMGLEKYKKKLIIDIDDHPFEIIKQQSEQSSSVLNHIFLLLRAHLVRSAMRRLIGSIKGALVPNEKYIDLPNIYYLPNVSYYAVENELPNTNVKIKKILFVGKLDYAPNYQGLSHFIKNVWPIVLESYSNVELEIVGKDSGTIDLTEYYKLWNNTLNVNVVGFVENIYDNYKDCYLTISPIYSGSGTNIKVLESAQMKRTCVTTICGIRGLEKYFKDKEDILVAKDDKDYAELILSIIEDSRKNFEIAMNAYKKADRFFSKKIFNQVLNRVINSNF